MYNILSFLRQKENIHVTISHFGSSHNQFEQITFLLHILLVYLKTQTDSSTFALSMTMFPLGKLTLNFAVRAKIQHCL